MTRSRISMMVAAGALVLVGLLAFALFTPDKPETTEATSKEKAIEKMPAPKTDTVIKPIITTNHTPQPIVINNTPPAPPVERKPEPPKPAPAPAIIDYTIKRGDMISKLAARNGISTADIYAVNPGLNDSNASKIREGTVIKLPTGPGAKAEEPKVVEAPKVETGFQARVVRAKAGQDAASLAREYYGSLAPMAAIANANADTLGLGFRCKGGEEIVLPAWGTVSGSRIENTGTEAAKPVASRDSLIPKRP